MAGPSSASGIPPASRAAAGANTSRPWNVRETGWSMTSGLVMATASTTPPHASAAGISSPLSGPTKWRPSRARSATARRSEPTPGSTTARWTPTGRYWIAPARTRAPCPIACGWMPWVTWITRASGHSRLITPWQMPAKSSDVPKSDRKVTNGECSDAVMAPLYRRRSRSTAATSPSTVCGSASAAGSMPCSRSAALVTGPIEAARRPSRSRSPSAAARLGRSTTT